jgi:polyphosphate glucokinase
MKGAVVDLSTGRLVTERFRIPTPRPATPTAMAGVVGELADRADWDGPAGVAFPGIVRRGVIGSAANIDESWIGVDGARLFGDALGHQVTMINDADAAGLAEMTYGAGRGRRGVVIMLTFGTGIGSGLFVDGTLVPNTELGHLELDGHDAESRAAARVRELEGIGWRDWAPRVQRYLRHIGQQRRDRRCCGERAGADGSGRLRRRRRLSRRSGRGPTGRRWSARRSARRSRASRCRRNRSPDTRSRRAPTT